MSEISFALAREAYESLRDSGFWEDYNPRVALAMADVVEAARLFLPEAASIIAREFGGDRKYADHYPKWDDYAACLARLARLEQALSKFDFGGESVG